MTNATIRRLDGLRFEGIEIQKMHMLQGKLIKEDGETQEGTFIIAHNQIRKHGLVSETKAGKRVYNRYWTDDGGNEHLLEQIDSLNFDHEINPSVYNEKKLKELISKN